MTAEKFSGLSGRNQVFLAGGPCCQMRARYYGEKSQMAVGVERINNRSNHTTHKNSTASS